MSVREQITRIQNGKADLLNAISEKGVSVSSSTPIEELGAKVRQITSGGNSKLAERASGTIKIVLASDLEGATKLANSTFYKCDTLESLEIPSTVKLIAADSVRDCSSLVNVVMPDTIHTIYGSAFRNCTSLPYIKISSALTLLAGNVFNGCTNLKEVDFSNCTSVPTLEATTAFSSTHADLKIKVPNALYNSWKSATNWSSLASKIVKDIVYSEGLAYLEACDTCVGYEVYGIGDCTDTDIVIPPTYNGEPVTEICYTAFEGNEDITSVVIPDSVTTICDDAFSSCYNLTSVVIGNGVEWIGWGAFWECYNLTSVVFGNSVKVIGNSSFESCNLTSVEIPKSVTKIERYAFSCCGNLKRVDLSNHTSVPTIESFVFYDCHDDLQIKVPANLYDEFIEDTNWCDWEDYIVTEFTN